MFDDDGLLGWATNDLVQLDKIAPGLISRMLTISPGTRHAALLVLAHRRVMQHKGHLPAGWSDVALANLMRDGRARDIIETTLGSVEDGLLGALERLAPTPLSSPDSYIRLRALFRCDRYRLKAEALRYVGQITERMLQIADALDPRWVHRETLSRIDSAAEARDFNAALTFVQGINSRATDENLLGAINRLPPTGTLAGMIERFVRRADRFPPNPIVSTEDLRPLVGARDLIEAGRRLRNCLAAKVEDALVGRVAYAEYRQEWIVELRPLTGAAGWIVWDVHAARNGLVPRSVAQAARNACLAQGIPALDGGDTGQGWRAYRRFTCRLELVDWAE